MQIEKPIHICYIIYCCVEACTRATYHYIFIQCLDVKFHS